MSHTSDSDALTEADEPERESRLTAIAIIVIAASLALFAWAWSQERGESGDDDSVSVGQAAPDFTLPMIDGEEATLSDYRGEVVLINFWATWCPPCRAEMPELEAVYRQHRDEGFEILGIDQAESADLVSSYVNERDFSWTFMLDEDFAVSRDYQATSIPRSLLIDRDGTVVHIWTGALTRSALENQLRNLDIGG